MTFGLIFNYAFAAALGASCGILAVTSVLGVISTLLGLDK